MQRKTGGEEGGQDYKTGDITTLASKRKAVLVHMEPGTFAFPIDVINLLPNVILINICHIELGNTSDEQTRSLDIVRDPSQTDAQSIRTARPSLHSSE